MFAYWSREKAAEEWLCGASRYQENDVQAKE